MKNKLCAVITLAGLLALSGTASAHDMEGKGDWGGHGHMCKSSGLTDENEKLCHTAMMSAMKKDKALFGKMHDLHEKLHAVLVAKDFDKKAFLSLSGQMEQLHDQMMRHHAEAFASIAAKLSPEERKKMMGGFHEHGMDSWEHHGMHAQNSQPRSQNNQSNDWERNNLNK